MGRLAALCVLSASCSSPPSPPYRFDDHLEEARTVAYAAGAGGEASAAPTRIAYEFEDAAEGWTGSRDMGAPAARGGFLVFEPAPGAGKAAETETDAEIRSPALDVNLDRFRDLEIRMRIRGARSFRVRWDTAAAGSDPVASPDNSSPRKLVPRDGGFVDYRISTAGMRLGSGSRLANLSIAFPNGSRPGVEIDHVRFTPGAAGYFERPRGRFQDSIGGVVRRGFFLRTPGALVFETGPSRAADLTLGMGLLERTGGVDFAVAIETEGKEGKETEVFRRRLTSPEAWQDARIELPASPRAGRRIVFRAESAVPGEAALWATPLLVERGGGRKAAPSAVIYLMDALRADELGVMGRTPTASPALDSIARSGALFRRGYSTTNWTRPAVASLFTSLYPEAHGVAEGAARLPDEATTLFEAARAEGYLTALFTVSPHAGSNINFQQGVDFVFEPSSILGGVDRDGLGRPSSDRLNETFFRWLDTCANPGLPFLAYLHSLDTHDPYWPPKEYGARFVPGYEGPGPGGELGDGLGEKDAARLRGLYDAELAFNDDSIAVLVARLKRKGLLRDMLLVFLSDHGEEFHDHGRWGHGHHLTSELLRIPLVFSMPGRIGAGRAVEEPVSLVDVAPTVLDLLGLKIPEAFQGQSLLGYLDAKKEAVPNPRPLFASFRSRQYAILDGRWKLVQMGEKKQLLYDLETDPGERRNLAEVEPERAAALRAEIERWRKDQTKLARAIASRAPRETSLDVETNEALRALGYAQ